MKTVRQKIIQHLKERRVTTAEELSRLIETSPANARHHLAGLEAEGIVEVIGKQSGAQGGRPRQRYGLVEQTRQHNFEALAHVLLDNLSEGLAIEEKLTRMKQIAGRLAALHKPAPANLAQRLAVIVRQLDEMGYLARWEAHASAPRIILGHCPYAAILPDHPELCLMDTLLLEAMARLPATQIARLEKGPQGFAQCIWQIAYCQSSSCELAQIVLS